MKQTGSIILQRRRVFPVVVPSGLNYQLEPSTSVSSKIISIHPMQGKTTKKSQITFQENIKATV